jgi:energy-coupling factor transport system permease protein
MGRGVAVNMVGNYFFAESSYPNMPRTVLFTILPERFPILGTLTGGIHVYKEGAEYGLIQATRIGITTTCGLFVCFTTEAKDILRAAIRLKLPYTLLDCRVRLSGA